jgi:glycerophosphoryl diester phosphodiesterase
MDVEGYELEVIKGMTKFLKNNDKDKRISLHIEIKQEKTYKEIMKIFKSCMKKVNVKKLTSEDYLFKNF